MWRPLALEALFRAGQPLAPVLDAERSQRLAIRLLGSSPFASEPGPDDAILATRAFGLAFPNPIGLAAGLDKNAEATDGLSGLGFGALEVGTATPLPQPGNPKPRLWRLPVDGAVINHLGFNNGGLDALLRNLERRRIRTGMLGINLGKNRDATDEVADYVTGVRRAAPMADYLVINVSSPNTPGLRDLQARGAMTRLVSACLQARDAIAMPSGRARPPLLVKLAPDLNDSGLADAAAVALELGVDGLIMGNTTIGRPDTLRDPLRREAGGLSGRPLFALSTARLAELARMTEGRIPLVGCGGVASGADAYAKIRAGASLVQLYSALVFEGPGLVPRIKRDLAALLRRDGFGSVAEAVGVDVRSRGREAVA